MENYKQLKDLLKRANNAYYKDSNPIMSDKEFDMKMKELEEAELARKVGLEKLEKKRRERLGRQRK